MEASTIRKYRIVLFLLAIFTQVREQTIQCIESPRLTCLKRNKYLTIQTNWLIIIWLAIMIFSNPRILKGMEGIIHGALMVQISVVAIAYWVLIAPTDETLYTFTNFAQHLVVPILFLGEWVISENTLYHWKYILYWLAYPLFYAPFALLNGTFEFILGYIYPFLNVPVLGWRSVLTTILEIFALFGVLSVIYIAINRKYLISDVGSRDQE